MNGTAEFSECQRFRYTLTRTWGIEQKLCVVGLNPSTATADVNDRTIRRCMDYAKRWGHGGLLMLNLFAYRTAFPSEMWEARARGVDIIGGERNYYDALRGYIDHHCCPIVLAAWGRHGGERGRAALRQLPRLHYLALNSDDSPKHPLYLKGDLKPLKFAA
jgi:hypothetical protein